MKYLIVGSSGFLGSHLCDFLLSAHQEVFKCDIADFPNDSKYFCIKSAQQDFDRIFNEYKFDVCINASGSGSVANSFSTPLTDFSLNTSNVLYILEAIRQHNSDCKFINFSSAAVYGNPVEMPIKETSVLKPLSPYGMHKQISEILCKEYYDFFGIPTCSLRVFSAYGARLNKQIFWDLNLKAKSDSAELILYGTGDETRDFIYVEDIAKVVKLIVENNFFSGVSVNVANGQELSIRAVATEFLKQAGCGKKILFSGIQKTGDPFRWKADISLMKNLGYTPSVEIEEGIHRYVTWLKNTNN